VRHDSAKAHRPKAKLRRPGVYKPLTGAFASDSLLLALESTSGSATVVVLATVASRSPNKKWEWQRNPKADPRMGRFSHARTPNLSLEPGSRRTIFRFSGGWSGLRICRFEFYHRHVISFQNGKTVPARSSGRLASQVA
jgi:hypothetical protein